jgi:malate dehydrogenase
MDDVVRVAVTGAAGQISYALLFRIAAGDVFGPDHPVELRLIEIEPAMEVLEGVAMELDDCAFPLLESLELTTNLAQGFDGVNWALLIGAAPRKRGMERRDLLGVNGKIFKPQGKAIADNAASDVRILVVGNPCNTNALIARENGRDVPPDRWFSMMRLDENRARSQLARRADRPVASVTNVAVWGNHSTSQYPDYEHALIDGKPAVEVLGDRRWFENDFIPSVQRRGAAVIEARGSSSAASAANAIIDSVRSIAYPTPENDWHSVAVCSDGSYGVPEGLQFGFPVRSDGLKVTIVDGLKHSESGKKRIEASIAELESERAEISHLLT